MNPIKVLVVDDNQDICTLLRMNLESEGYSTIIANDGEEAVSKCSLMRPDIVLLDVMLPGMDGFQVLQEIRKTSNVPVIIISAKSDTVDMVWALRAGASDYIAKPFQPKEVLARVAATIRDRALTQSAPRPVREVHYDKLSVNLDSYELRVDGKLVDAPAKEIDLLYFLASHPQRVYTRDQLLDEVWDYDYYGDSRTIDVHIKRLREKIEGVSDQWEIQTVWRVGYKFALLDGSESKKKQ